MRSRTIRPIVAGLASVAVLAGCSGGGPDWQAGGIDLDGLEESLEAIDAAWRSQLTAGEVRVNLTESARCSVIGISGAFSNVEQQQDSTFTPFEQLLGSIGT